MHLHSAIYAIHPSLNVASPRYWHNPWPVIRHKNENQSSFVRDGIFSFCPSQQMVGFAPVTFHESLFQTGCRKGICNICVNLQLKSNTQAHHFFKTLFPRRWKFCPSTRVFRRSERVPMEVLDSSKSAHALRSTKKTTRAFLKKCRSEGIPCQNRQTFCDR